MLLGTWDLPRLKVEPMFPALAGGFLIIEPRGKPFVSILIVLFFFLFGEIGRGKNPYYMTLNDDEIKFYWKHVSRSV